MIAPLARATARPGADAELGGFGGFFDPKRRDIPIRCSSRRTTASAPSSSSRSRPASTTRSASTSSRCASTTCIVQGAEPLFFLDYFATAALDTGVAAAVVAGIADGCRIANCALIGGETAEMPGMYAPGDYDLAGFSVGAVERGQQLTGDRVRAGDVLLGLASSGAHSNGFSLIRRIVERSGARLDRPAPFDIERLLGDALLEPTRIYVRSLLPSLKAGRINALAHITGGGLLENVPRILPAGCHAHIDAGAWPLPPLFAWLQAQGRIEPGELARTFNCGIGMVLAVAADRAADLTQVLSDAGETVHRIGRIDAGERGCTVAGADEVWSGRGAWAATHWGHA